MLTNSALGMKVSKDGHSTHHKTIHRLIRILNLTTSEMCPWVCPQRCCNSIDSCLVFIKSSFAVISGNGTSSRSPWEGLGTITASHVSERNSLELIITTGLVSKLGCRNERGKQMIKTCQWKTANAMDRFFLSQHTGDISERRFLRPFKLNHESNLQVAQEISLHCQGC